MIDTEKVITAEQAKAELAAGTAAEAWNNRVVEKQRAIVPHDACNAEMNDNDIIKALEFCADGFCFAENSCPLGHIGDADACITELCKNALDLINRQKAEIEELKTKLSHSIGVDNTKQNGCFPFD